MTPNSRTTFGLTENEKANGFYAAYTFDLLEFAKKCPTPGIFAFRTGSTTKNNVPYNFSVGLVFTRSDSERTIIAVGAGATTMYRANVTLESTSITWTSIKFS